MAADRFHFPASLKPAADFAPEETGYVVTFRDLPEAITQGEDLDDALAMAADCLEEAITVRLKLGETIPEPSDSLPGDYPVGIGSQLATKAVLCEAMRRAGVTKSELARRLNWDEKEVRRLLDPRYGTKLPRIERALAALGKRLVIDAKDAA